MEYILEIKKFLWSKAFTPRDRISGKSGTRENKIKLKHMPKFEEEKQKRRYGELLEKEAEDLAKILAQKHGIPYLDLSGVTIDLDSLKLVSEAEAREGH